MTEFDADVAIIGAGFGGSLAALLCDRIGLRPVLIERGTHPRFAIGESSTPVADLVLRDLSERYDLPRLRPLTTYGSWRKAYPQVACGLKRGFSYFHHRQGQPFVPRDDHANELLVAASPDDEHGDTHWYRPDVDHFFVREVVTAGIPYLDRTEIERLEDGDPWRIVARREGSPIHLRAAFVIDAAGGGGMLASTLGIASAVESLCTNSRSVYAHFEGVRRWADVYSAQGGRIEDHPFDCDAAALHHLFDGGWMWMLRFDNGITSAGFVLEPTDPSPGNAGVTLSVEAEWASLLRRFPSIAQQFAGARVVHPLQRTKRLQRRASRAAGRNWAMLPHAAYFLDPLHSAGNAHTLVGLERLIRILAEAREPNDRAARLVEYDRILQIEVDVLDRVIHGCYRGFQRFDLFAAFAMFYFAAATTTEERRRAGRNAPADAFLLAHDARFRTALEEAYQEVQRLAAKVEPVRREIAEFEDLARRLVGPYNTVGLADPGKRNMYPYV